ncbi:unnamed protein product [Dovyalis caffra]|uniref:Uncharacterized protein n=1 Tax=Dovyalis caffra TaxID=77055 RepID=A0AAV1RWK3_9ROSI|nr:unnamed protein product [Dovyalis caffra]
MVKQKGRHLDPFTLMDSTHEEYCCDFCEMPRNPMHPMLPKMYFNRWTNELRSAIGEISGKVDFGNAHVSDSDSEQDEEAIKRSGVMQNL